MHLGSYGIGITRLMGVISEKFADARGLVWPESIAPAIIQLIPLGDDPEIVKAANNINEAFTREQISVIYDDRDMRAGQKFADADLLGTPFRVVISKKTLENNAVELKPRTAEESTLIPIDNLISKFKNRGE